MLCTRLLIFIRENVAIVRSAGRTNRSVSALPDRVGDLTRDRSHARAVPTSTFTDEGGNALVTLPSTAPHSNWSFWSFGELTRRCKFSSLEEA